MTASLTERAGVRGASERVLDGFAASAPAKPAAPGYRMDAGPAVLAGLLATDDQRSSQTGGPVARTLAAWLGPLRHGCTHRGLFSCGLAGYTLGLRTASAAWPALSGLSARTRAELITATRQPWQREQVAWYDYDLITGPAGVALVLASNPACLPDDIDPVTGHLVSLCDDDDLHRLRVGHYQGERMRGWNYGRINTGLAHGAAGVAAALNGATDVFGLTPGIASALTRLSRWLLAQAYTDSRGLITWPDGGLDGAAPYGKPHYRQAWCYGTPGVAWTLWETGRVLTDAALREFAEQAMISYLDTFDAGFYRLDLSICHGIPGVLLLADAFDRYAHLPGAAGLRARLRTVLCDRLPEVIDLASTDATLLSGAPGACAALLTLDGGDRGWLPAFGLR